ncbi:MAG: universal stress protein [Saprospiraceae bacterium]
MKKILVPVDFSACSAHAFKLAVQVAGKTGAALHALHVLFPNEGVDNNIYNAFWVDDYLVQRQKELKNWVRRRVPAGLRSSVTQECLVGFPVPSIHNAAAAQGADLIIMGTTGATGLRGVFLGSVAAGVVGKTALPVLVVPPKGHLRERADVVFATDYQLKVVPGDLAVLQTLIKLYSANLKVVHILDKPGEKPDAHREATFKAKLGELPCAFHHLHDQDVPQAVSNYLDAVDAGLLVAVAHRHTLLHRLFYDSVTRRLAHRTRVPLLVLHDAETT